MSQQSQPQSICTTTSWLPFVPDTAQQVQEFQPDKPLITYLHHDQAPQQQKPAPPSALVPYTTFELSLYVTWDIYAPSHNMQLNLHLWQPKNYPSAYVILKTSSGDVLECNQKEYLIQDCDRVEEGFDDSTEKIRDSSAGFSGVETAKKEKTLNLDFEREEQVQGKFEGVVKVWQVIKSGNYLSSIEPRSRSTRHTDVYGTRRSQGGGLFVNLSFARIRGEECSSGSEKVDHDELLRSHCFKWVTLKELVKHSFSMGDFLKKDHPHEKELLSIQDFFR